MEDILKIIKDGSLDFRQKRHALAAAAENSLPYVSISNEAEKYLQSGIICDLFEGHAPYRPRYILPDYSVLMEKGCEYLEIEKPKDMYEAINALLIMYSHVPSITSYPVYLGDIDLLLEPLVNTVTEQELENLLKMFLINIDRTLPDAFVHMDIGPKDTKVGRLILKLEKQLKKAIPNITLKYSKDTSAEFAKLAAETALTIGKPYFANDAEIKKSVGKNYSVASCYNTLKIGGGSYTLVRLNLKKLAEKSIDYENFLKIHLPNAVNAQCEIINSRARFIVEEVKFFENSFLSKEGFIDIKNFTSMAGVFGLYECVEKLTNGLKIGKNEEADKMAETIVKTMFDIIKSNDGAYCYGYNNKIGFHAQSGIDSDIDVTAGVRLKIGEEIPIFDQILIQGKLQKYFDTGVSDIYVFDKTAEKNINGVLKIINGAMKSGIKVFALNSSDSDLIRITGYLVKKSDVDKYFNGQQVRETTVKFGGDSIKKNNILGRKVRTSSES